MSPFSKFLRAGAVTLTLASVPALAQSAEEEAERRQEEAERRQEEAERRQAEAERRQEEAERRQEEAERRQEEMSRGGKSRPAAPPAPAPQAQPSAPAPAPSAPSPQAKPAPQPAPAAAPVAQAPAPRSGGKCRGGKYLFGEAATHPVGKQPSNIAVADFNADGKLDMAVANPEQSGAESPVSIFLGKGDGSFTKGKDVMAISPFSVASGDFDEDGKL
ncbi:MAG TPA: VCBS repeat-containing protein, partial [Myxococcaceae bacterium]